MTDETYNGWRNRATWLVGLYLDGNYDGEDTYREVLDIASSFARAAELDGSLEAPRGDELLCRDLGEYLEEWVAARISSEAASLETDLLGTVLALVDWYQLAECKLDELAESDQVRELTR